MPQQMEFDEARSERQGSSFDNYEAGYRDPFAEAPRQKVSPHQTEKGPSAAQRLALAIVSLCVLMFTSLGAMGFLTNGGQSLDTSLVVPLCIIIGLFCLTTIAVNAFFNIYGNRSK